MARIIYPINGKTYTAEDVEIFNSPRTSGIYSVLDFDCSLSGNVLTIGKGLAWIKNGDFTGKCVAFTEPETLTLDSADSTKNRFDVVAIRYDASKTEPELVIIKGATGDIPMLPERKKETYLYELFLYAILRKAGEGSASFENLSDLRDDETFCGIMRDSVTSSVAPLYETLYDDETGMSLVDGHPIPVETDKYVSYVATVKNSDMIVEIPLYAFDDTSFAKKINGKRVISTSGGSETTFLITFECFPENISISDIFWSSDTGKGQAILTKLVGITKQPEGYVKVDSLYNPESHNAQSGEAVKQAIEEALADFGGVIDIEVEPFDNEPQPTTFAMRSTPTMANETGVTVKNYITNGNFESEADWSVVSGGTLTVADNEAVVYNDGSTGTINGIKQNIDAGERGFVVGDKWFIKINMSVQAYTLDNGKALIPQHQIYINNGGLQYAFNFASAVEGESFENVDKYGILTAGANVAKADLYARVQYSQSRYATNKTTVFKNIVAVNLTEVYGEGSEPTADEFYELLSTLDNAWFDGTITLGGSTGGGEDDIPGGDVGGDDNDDGGNGGNTDIVSGSGYKLIITTAKETKTLYLYQGQDGEDGKDGFSPTINVEKIDGGYRLIIVDKNGEQSVDLIGGSSTDEKFKEDVTEALGEVTSLEDLTNTLVIETGSINASSGEIIASVTDGKACQPFEVKAGEVYHVSGAVNTVYCLIALYDENKNFIAPVGVGTSPSATKIENEIYVVPEDALDKNGNEKKVAYMACSTKLIADKSGVDLSVKREITKYNNLSETVSNAIEDCSSQKLDKVLCSPNGDEWVLTITNDGVIKAIKRRNTGDDVVTTLTLPSDLPVGVYALRYENAQDALTDYADICSVEVATEGENAVYNGLIAENVAPSNATSIGVYNKADNSKVGSIELGFLQNDYPEKLYSFGAISDIHIGQSDSVEDFTNAIEFFNNSDVEFITTCGDMVDDASDTSVGGQLDKYQVLSNELEKPIYVAMGNHEANKWESFDNVKTYFEQDNFPGINQELYYTFMHGDDVFIILGTNGEPNYNKTFSLDELKWLYRTLEENRNRRCFLFTHYYPIDGSGDPLGLYEGNGFANLHGSVFLNLMKHYKNVIYFHGHTHTAFEVQNYNATNNIDKKYGRYSVHVPSLTWPRVPNATLTDYDKKGAKGEGYVINVYENGIGLCGRDFEENKYLPIGNYYLDTVTQKIEANTFYDEYNVLETPIKK